MKAARSLLLLEVLIGLLLLANLGVALLRLQAGAVRQIRQAEDRVRLVRQVEELLWDWRVTQRPVTLPETGTLDGGYRWRREVQPLRVADGVFATQVRLVIERMEPNHPAREAYRVAWLVPPARKDQR